MTFLAPQGFMRGGGRARRRPSAVSFRFAPHKSFGFSAPAVFVIVVQPAPQPGQPLLAIKQMFGDTFPDGRCADKGTPHKRLFVTDLEDQHCAER